MASALGTYSFASDFGLQAQPAQHTLLQRRSRRAQIRSSALSVIPSERSQAAELNMSQRRAPARTTAGSTSIHALSDPAQTAPDVSSTSSRPPRRNARNQRSSSQMDPTTMRSITYTRTGRISKARKGVKGAHTCACGKTYSRAEHLRRHQQNHGDILYCKYPDCNKTFHRQDLLRRHEEKHLQGEPMQSSPVSSPSMVYTTASDVESIMTTSLSHQPTPAFSPAPTQTTSTSQPSTPFNDPSAIMSAPRYTASQFNHFRSKSQQSLSGSFPFADAKPKTVVAAGVSLQASPSLTISQQRLEHTPASVQEMTAGTTFSTTTFDAVWPNYAQTYVPNHALESLYGARQSPIVTSHEVWPQHQAGHGSLVSPPVSATGAPNNFWYSTEKHFGSLDSGLALSYPMELQSMVTPATDIASPYVRYATTTDWEQSSIHSVTPITVKAELSPPVAILDSQSLSTTLGLHAKQSYVDAYWEYFHPLYPVLHKPTMEQQRQVDQQQSDSGLLLKAAIVMCGATFTKDEARWNDGKTLLKKSMQFIQQEHIFPSSDLRIMQAIFLLEAYSQFYNHRAPSQLSETFNAMLSQLQHDPDLRTAAVRPIRLASPFVDDQLSHQWIQWIYTHAKQRLLHACNVLMTQTALYLTHDSNSPRMPWYDLPLPCSVTLWEASNAAQWRAMLLHEPHPVSIADTLANLASPQYHYFDRFQSAILITAQALSHAINPATSQALSLAVPEVLEVQIHLHAMLMSQSLPLRALLSVAGESWTPGGGRLATHARAAADLLGHMKSALRNWVNQGFVSPRNASGPTSRRSSVSQDLYSDNTAHRAVKHALMIIRIAAKLEEDGRPLPFAGEMPLFAATLVIWAVGFEATQRTVNPQYGTTTPPGSGSSDLTTGGSRQGVAAFIHATDTGLLGRLWSGGDLSAALLWRQGVDAIMRWTRLRIGGLPTAPPTATGHLGGLAAPSSTARPRSQSLPQLQSQTVPQSNFTHQARESQLSELAAGAVNVLRRLESRQNRNWF